jgi:endonuclease-3 related protein
MSFAQSYSGVAQALEARYGRPFAAEYTGADAILAAFLRQASDPKRVDTTLSALRDAGLLDVESLATADPAELAETMRAANLAYTPKAMRVLRDLARWVVEHGSLEAIANLPTATVRDQLLTLNGIGQATADAILLFGLCRPVYPVDRATYRVLVRHGWLDPTAEYEEARAVVETCGHDHATRFTELLYWMERVGTELCRPRIAKCERCALRSFLPEGGPREPEA